MQDRPGEPTTARTYVSMCLCMQANRCKHVRTFLTGYRSGGTPCVFTSRGVCWNCGPLTREQCLPAPWRPPGSSCCLSLLAGGFRPTTRACTSESERGCGRQGGGVGFFYRQGEVVR